MHRLSALSAALMAVAVLFLARAVPSNAHGWVEIPASRNFLLATDRFAKSAGNGLGPIVNNNPVTYQNPTGPPGKLRVYH